MRFAAALILLALGACTPAASTPGTPLTASEAPAPACLPRLNSSACTQALQPTGGLATNEAPTLPAVDGLSGR